MNEAVVGGVIAGVLVALIVAAFGKKLRKIGAFLITTAFTAVVVIFVFSQLDAFFENTSWPRLSSFLTLTVSIMTWAFVYNWVRDWFDEET